MSVARQTAANQLPALTGLRFYLAVWVVIHHLCGGARMLEPAIRTLPDPLETFLRSGFWAVGTFFVLSGFVLARGYAATQWRRHSLIRYGAARVARIYPVYFLSLVVVAPFIYEDLFSRAPAKLAGARAFLLIDYTMLLQGWTGTLPVHWNTPAWSLSCEVFFYLCFPLALMLFRCSGWKRSAAAAGVALALPVLLPALGLPEAWKPLTHLGDFLLGMAVAGLFDALLARRPGLAGRGTWFYAPAGIAAVALIAFSSSVERWLPLDLAIRPLNALLLFGLALGGGWFAAVLSARPSLLLGKASYALYILHIPVLWWYKRSWLYLHLAAWPAGAALVYIAGAVLISAAVFKWFEEPANRYLRGALSARLAPSRST